MISVGQKPQVSEGSVLSDGLGGKLKDSSTTNQVRTLNTIG